MRSPIRVAHIMPQIGVGGAESQLRVLIAGSDPHDVCHKVLHYSDSNDLVEVKHYAGAGISPIRVLRQRRRPIRFFKELTKAIDAHKADIAQCWMVSGSFWGRLAAMRVGVRHIVISYRSARLTHVPALRILEFATGRRVTYLANSRACAQAVASRLSIPPDRFHVIHNGVDVQRFNIPPDRCGLLSELGIPNECKLVICLARLTAAKDHATLLRAARCCLELPVHFLLVGHGELESQLRQLADRLGVSKTVHFLGLRTDVPRLLRSVDLACFTSLWEGFPNTLLEAMAAGLPTISTRFAGVGEILENGVHGLTVPCGDDAALFEAIHHCLRDQHRAVFMGQAARARAQSQFSVEAMVLNTVKYYRSLLTAGA